MAGQSSSGVVVVLGVVVLLAGGAVVWRVLDRRAEEVALREAALAAREEALRAAAGATPAAGADPFAGVANVASRSRVQAINRMNEGIALFDRNDFAGAEEAVRDATRTDPTYAAAHHTLAQIYKKQNKLAEAEAEFQAAVASMGAEPQGEYFYDLGAVQSMRGDAEAPGLREPRYRAALQSYQDALKVDPQIYKAHYRMANAYEKLAMFAEADAAYRKTIEIKPSYSPAFVSLGNMYLDRGDTDAAMTVLNKGAELNDHDPRMWNGLGRAQYQLGRMQEAVEAYKKARSFDPDDVDAVFGLGMAYTELRMRKEAAENLRLYLAKAGPDARPDLLATARGALARIEGSL